MSSTPEVRSSLAGHALYLDIDGTLLEIAPSPDAVEVPVWMVPLLQRLSQRLDGAVAFVSGRTIACHRCAVPAAEVRRRSVCTAARSAWMDRSSRWTTSWSADLQGALPLLREAIAPLRGV